MLMLYCFTLFAQDITVEKALKSQFSYVQYYPNNGGWYLLKYTKNGQTYYGMGDSRGNVVVSNALAYRLYDGFIEFNLIDMQKKSAHDMWQQSMKDYHIAYQHYEKVKAEHEGLLEAYNTKVAYAKTVAQERYKQQVAYAQRQAQLESQKNAANYSNAGTLGAILGGIAAGVSQVAAVKSVDYNAIEKKVLAENNLLTPPVEPYNPKPKQPTEPENGYYWKAFSFQQPCPYSEIDYKSISVKDGFADVKKDGKYGLVNARMEVIIPCISSTRVKKEIFPNKNILVCINAKYGILSPIGQEILPCEYTEIKLSEGYLLCKKDNKWGVFTAHAKELYPCQYQNIRLDKICGKLTLFTQQKGLWGLTDFRSGKELLPTNFSEMKAFGPNNEFIKTIKDEKVGLYTNDGILIFPCEYNSIEHGTVKEYSSAFQLKKGNIIGLYDSDGVAIIPVDSYSSYSPINQNFLVCRNGQYGIYAPYNREIVPCKYNHNIRHFASQKFFVVSNINGTTLVNFSGEELFEPIPNIKIVDVYKDYVLVRNGAKFGAINYAGQIIVPLKFKVAQINKKVEAYAKSKKHNLKLENQALLQQANDAYINFYTQHIQVQSSKQKFSFFAQNYVERIINDWQKKGEFEKIDDWKKRVNVETRKQMVYTLTKDAQKAYLERYQEALPEDKLEIVGTYDPDNETYRIKTKYSSENILVPVPANEAQEFKTMFASLKKEPTFYVENDKVGLAEYTFYLSDSKVYKYSNEASLKYNIAQVDYDFDEISIETNISPSTKRGKQTFSTSNILIGKSDVDMNIPMTTQKQENTFVVIIANTNYDDAPIVQYAYNDGIIFKDYCIRTLGIPEENIQFKADATFNHIRQSINWLREVAHNEVLTENKKLIFYYSGHGIPDELTKSTYLLPKDGVAIDIVNTGYKVSDLYDMLAEISSESVVFLDACFSGLTKSGGALASTKGVVRVNNRIPQGNSVIFSASSNNEVAHQYEEKAHGLFTYFLLKGLQNSKGEISFDQLFEYISKEVARTSLTNTKIKKSQTPTIVAGAKANNWKERTLL